MVSLLHKAWLSLAMLGVLVAGMQVEIRLVTPSEECCGINACCCQAETESGCCEMKQPKVTVTSSCDCGGGGEHLLLAGNGFVFVPSGEEATTRADEPCDTARCTWDRLPSSRTTVPETPPPQG